MRRVLLIACAIVSFGLAGTVHAQDDVRRALKEEIAKRKLTECNASTNLEGYSTDGRVNFNSFLDNQLVSMKIDDHARWVTFKLTAIPGMESTMTVYVTDIATRISGFHIVTHKLTTREIRGGTLLTPTFEKVEEREVRFNYSCNVE